jgi:hypothetical protein
MLQLREAQAGAAAHAGGDTRVAPDPFLARDMVLARRRYERAKQELRLGSALVQRHVALPHDLVNREGRGLLVKKEDLDNPEVLGQVELPSTQFM